MDENMETQKPFFKTGFGIILIIIITLFSIIALTFGAFFFYYLYTQKYGSPETQKKISEKFNPTFSKIPGQRSIPNIKSDKDIHAYIRPFNPTLGPKTAPVTILTFIDFECPYSHKSFPIFENIIKKFEGTVQIVFKNFPIEALHPNAKLAANYASCINKQGSYKFWEFYRSAFAAPELNQNTLELLSLQSGANPELLQICLNDNTSKDQNTQDLQDGIDLHVEGTPTYFVNQRLIQGVLTEDEWSSVIVQELQKKK